MLCAKLRAEKMQNNLHDTLALKHSLVIIKPFTCVVPELICPKTLIDSALGR